MNFLEFQEGFSRVAERISPMPPYFFKKELDSVERQLQPLFHKIEGFVFIVYLKIKNIMQYHFSNMGLNVHQINNKIIFCSSFDNKVNGNLIGLQGEVLSSESESEGENNE